MLKPLALALLLSAAPVAFAAPYTINVSGTFRADNSELDNPASPNTLTYLDGLAFTGSFTLDDAPLNTLLTSQYVHEINIDNESWFFHTPYHVTLDVPNVFGFTSQGTVLRVENDWFYDGSEGFVPAGNYDSIGINGWNPSTTCSNCGGIDWGQTTPLITGHTFWLGLDGYSNMLQGPNNLGVAPNLANVLFGQMDLTHYVNGETVGFVRTEWGPVAGSLSEPNDHSGSRTRNLRPDASRAGAGGLRGETAYQLINLSEPNHEIDSFTAKTDLDRCFAAGRQPGSGRSA